MFYLQYRWKLNTEKNQLVYYGLRNWPNNKRQIIKLSAEELSAIRRLPAELTDTEQKTVRALTDDGIIVTEQHRPATADSYQTCVKCVNNDYVIPGLEFDSDGVCAFCQCYDNEKIENKPSFNAVSEEDLIRLSKSNKESRFDVMVFFTGGKDSTFLVWYLSKQLGLRVLAVFWNMPYTNDSSRENIKRVLKNLPNVEYIQWDLPMEMMHNAMRTQYGNVGMFCLCPIAAFPLFYPIAHWYKIPYVISGVEDVQLAVMEYVFTMPPQKMPVTDRDMTLGFLKSQSTPRPIIEPVTYGAEVGNYSASAIDALPDIFGPLRGIIEQAAEDPDMKIPLVKRLSTGESFSQWDNVIETIQKEVGWQMPAGQTSKLHTSCAIEPVKDYTQFLNFRDMKTVFFPQSMIELSAAVYFGHLNRAEALKQMTDLGYMKEPEMYGVLKKQLNL